MTDTSSSSQPMISSPWKRVLVPVDFSAPSEAAFAYALRLAHTVGAEVRVCHIIPTPHMLDAFYERGLAPPDTVKRITQKARKRIKELAATHASTVPFHMHCQEGEAAETILQQAETLKVDLIVMGTHGRSGAERFFLGSVAETVVRRAPCPVLTLRV